MKKIVIVIAVLAVVVLGACKGSQKQNESVEPVAETAWYENDSLLEAQLMAAIEVAKRPDSTKISHDLMPVKKGYPGEEWTKINGKDMVLLVTMVDSSRLQRFFGRDDVYRIERELGTWVTLPADWLRKKDAFVGLDSVAAHMRMIQMYGLSPDCNFNIMVYFYADPTYMFRPAHDPDITTTTVGLEFPAYANENYKVGDTNFREWFRYSYESAYEDDSPLPWTQLGYTYDWHEGADPKGLSEYIVTDQCLIKVKSHESEWSFIQNLLKQ